MAAQTQTTKLRVESLHALAYCERLFYLEEVESVRLAFSARPFTPAAGCTSKLERDAEGEWHTLELQSEQLGAERR